MSHCGHGGGPYYDIADIGFAIFLSATGFAVFSLSLMMIIAVWQDVFPKKKGRK